MLRLKTFAKINLSLKILGKRPDGYHEIYSLMQSVSLNDIVTLSISSSGVKLVTNHPRLPTDSRNLAYRAAEFFLGNRKLEIIDQIPGVEINIKKNIPVAAGLAGGSADAAAVLWGLNQMLEEDERYTMKELMELGKQIGSDVPFCLVGGTCWVRGRGELVEKKEVGNRQYYILVVPELEVSTKWAYETWDKKKEKNKVSKNDLEPIVIAKYPVVQEIKEKLKDLGCSYVQMSGSGPSIFGLVENQRKGERILSQVKKEFPQSFLVHDVERGLEIVSENESF